jgi:hypothetical protein
MPVVVSLPAISSDTAPAEQGTAASLLAGMTAERTPEIIPGSVAQQTIRLRLLSRLLQQWLVLNPE